MPGSAEACNSALLHFKLNHNEIKKIQSENPLHLSFQHLKDLKLKVQRIDLEILRKLSVGGSLAPGVLSHDREQANGEFVAEFIQFFRRMNSGVQQWGGGMREKYTLWHAYVEPLSELLPAWGVLLIYSTPEQIVCRGSGDHVIRFASDGSIYIGTLNLKDLNTIEDYGLESDPDLYRDEVKELLAHLQKVQ